MNIFDIIPGAELDRYGRLNDAAKKEFELCAGAVLKICGRIGSKGFRISHAIAEWASRLGCSTGNLRRKVDDWRRTGDWKCLVNKSLAGAEWWQTQSALNIFPEDFKVFWLGLRGKNQRGKAHPQYLALIRQWRRWLRGDLMCRIPGYDTPPADCGQGHPAGWSYRNLMRIKPRKVETLLVTIGTAAALRELPHIPGTRAGARFLEFVTIDDVWQDRKVIVPGYPFPARLLQMGAMDYASAVYLKFGLRPELPRDDGTRERLKERDAKELIAMLLEQYGYPADYVMHIICERGTATIRPADALSLFQLSGGRIKVCYTGMEGGLVLAHEESRSGNSRGKGYHESWHNLFHNEMASLPGQVGKDNAHQPAALTGMEREARNLTTASHFLAPELRERIRAPFSTLDQAHWETLDVVRRINHRRKHECEGFGEVSEWIVPGANMDPAPAEALMTLNPAMRELVEWRGRKETPMERMERLAQGVKFIRLPGWIMPRFYEDVHAYKKIERDRFTFEKRGVTYTFKPPTPEHELREDVKYLGYCAPVDPDVIHLTDEDGAFVATWLRERRIQRGDQKAVAEAIRDKQHLLNNAVSNVRRQQADFIAAEEQRIRQNVEVLAEAGLISDTENRMQDVNGVVPAGMAALQAATEAVKTTKQTARDDERELERIRDRARAALTKNQYVGDE